MLSWVRSSRSESTVVSCRKRTSAFAAFSASKICSGCGLRQFRLNVATRSVKTSWACNRGANSNSVVRATVWIGILERFETGLKRCSRHRIQIKDSTHVRFFTVKSFCCARTLFHLWVVSRNQHPVLCPKLTRLPLCVTGCGLGPKDQLA